jgi:hypothetical protein
MSFILAGRSWLTTTASPLSAAAGNSSGNGGRFDDTYLKARKMALARTIAPQGLMNTELKRSILLVNLLFSLPPPRRWASCAYKQLNLPARNESHPLTFS